MPFGAPGTEGARVTTPEAVSSILQTFASHGCTELDTAYTYTSGTSESFLGSARPSVSSLGLSVSTKMYPGEGRRHVLKDLRRCLDESLKRLDSDSVDIFYLHACDRQTPFEETFAATDVLFKEGKFKRLGISNYMSFEVAEAVMLCRANGWVQPVVYQGIYNAIHRSIEPELLVSLRKYGIAFYEYNALAGGFFTGKHLSEADLETFLVPSDSSNSTMPEPLANTRFDTTQHGSQARAYVSRYWTPQHLRALALISKATKPHGLSLTECALRWVSYHSAMKREYGDTVVIGASKKEYIEEFRIESESPRSRPAP